MRIGQKRSLRHIMRLIDSTIGVFGFNRRLVLTYSNARFAQILSRDPRSVAGWSLAAMGKEGLVRSLTSALGGDEGFFEGPGPVVDTGQSPWIAVRTAPERGVLGGIIGGVGIVVDLSDRKSTELALIRRWDFEKTIAKVSSRFAVSGDLDGALNASLADFGRIMRMDRVYVFQLAANGDAMDNTHEWCAQGVESYIGQLQGVPVNDFPWLIERLRRGETIRVDDVALLPAEAASERQEFEREGIKSLLMLPLKVDGLLAGLIGMDDVRGTGRWSVDDLNLLGTFSELVGSAIGRARTLEILRQNEERYRSVVDNAHDMIQILDSDGRFLFVNPAWLRVTGYTRDELVGRFLKDIAHEGSKSVCAQCLRNVLAGREVEGLAMKLIAKSGLPIAVEGNATAYRTGGRTVAVVGIMRDVTEQRKLEAQLRHAQKMEAIGTLTGGVAHDFNNILTAIIGYAQFVLMKEKENELVQRNVEKILASAHRAANLTQSMLAFSRKQTIAPAAVDLNEIVQSTTKLVERLLGENIALRASLTPEDVTLFADHTQIEQILMNLFTNARDAMPNGGTLSVSTQRIVIDAAFIRAHEYGELGTYALLTVTDTGAGMDAETRRRMFEPFFTTKEQGKGTGLGLAIVYGIVKQHGGYINCYSEPGIGTSFKVYLPVTAARVSAPNAPEAPATAHGSETILIAEDESDVRAVTHQILEDAGYTVIEAADGQEAIRKYEEHAEKIDLLILDLVMPRKSGREAYDTIRVKKPDMKVIFASGYPADFIQERGMIGDEFDFIAKPIPPSMLLRKVRDILDRT